MKDNVDAVLRLGHVPPILVTEKWLTEDTPIRRANQQMQVLCMETKYQFEVGDFAAYCIMYSPDTARNWCEAGVPKRYLKNIHYYIQPCFPKFIPLRMLDAVVENEIGIMFFGEQSLFIQYQQQNPQFDSLVTFEEMREALRKSLDG